MGNGLKRQRRSLNNTADIFFGEKVDFAVIWPNERVLIVVENPAFRLNRDSTAIAQYNVECFQIMLVGFGEIEAAFLAFSRFATVSASFFGTATIRLASRWNFSKGDSSLGHALCSFEAMRSNFYTNLILTIIAGCLLCIVFRDVNIPTTAQAALGNDVLQRFPVDVNIMEINGLHLNSEQVGDGSKPMLPVTVIASDK
jgi:hypothetical protein